MNSGTNRNTRILEELRKSMASEENEDKGSYTFRTYTIDGRRYSPLADLRDHEIKVVTPEEAAIDGFAKLLSESSDQKIREFARSVKNIAWLHQSGGENLKDTPLYQISKEYSDKTLSTRPGSVERDLLLITAVEKIKTAYRALVSEEEDG